jgi:hypothetical protein
VQAILILNGIGGTPGVIRTPDPLLRRQVLYPAELRAHTVETKQVAQNGEFSISSLCGGFCGDRYSLS